MAVVSKTLLPAIEARRYVKELAADLHQREGDDWAEMLRATH